MAYNIIVEGFRDVEYPMLTCKTYLDHEGTTVSCDPAELSGHAVDFIRNQALRFFSADPEHFDLVFSANAIAAIKLVAEFIRDPAASGSVSGTFWYWYHKDSHPSLIGVRELTNGTHHCFNNDEEVEEWLNGTPCVSNSGIKYDWPKRVRQSTDIAHQNTYSILDAAALATTTQLDFSDPDSALDFTALSFYKIFGFPDLGALIIRRKSNHILSRRKHFGGSTISCVTVLHESTFQRKNETIHYGLEDGTLPSHNNVALGCAIDGHERLYKSIKIISQHTLFLSNRLYIGISKLRHSNSRSLCIIYSDTTDAYPYTDAITQGATIAFNVPDIKGNYIGYSHIEMAANEKYKRAWSAGHRCGGANPQEIINGKPTGVVRASLGAMSIMAEVESTFYPSHLRTE
ncbi:hypothetical protein OIDMADRAFT_40203 [Oidiodendron maius Zn]|uniref:Aminotransferase class V domain-containing protein n=1 Tax=Oidiodendron maius (strain Zn) TaxID=913774 RepID=A0A0C3H7H6_OIDMZ|nr:hypothetical protein OIDMADRAFT_40203 [Oidiodendron maius Zn]